MQTHLRNAAIAVGANARPESDPLNDESLVTQPQLRRIAGDISNMTVWRWRKAGILPEPRNVRGRNYWRQRDVVAALRQLGEAEAC